MCREADLERSYLVTESRNFICEKIICIKWTRNFMIKKHIFRLTNFFGYVDELSLTDYDRIIIVCCKINIVL